MVCNSAFMRLAALALALSVGGPAFAEAPGEPAPAPQVALAAQPTAEKPSPEELGIRVKPNPQGATVGTLGRLYEQRLIVKAQVDLMNAQSQLKSKGVVSAKIDESYAPTVKMVQGVGSSLYATFLYPGNMTMDAREGDVISGGYKVESISVNQVVLSKDGERIRLGFSASPPTPLPSLDAPAYGAPQMPGRFGPNPGF